jgi:hypothetical protein
MSRSSTLLAASVAALVCSIALPATADLAAWDQARATTIAKGLAKACDDFDQTVRKQPGLADVGAGSAEAGFSLGHSSRALREQSLALSDHLEKGKSHDQTKNEWRTLKEVSDDIAESGRHTPLEDPLLAAWSKVQDQMRQLAPYYDPKALNP